MFKKIILPFVLLIFAHHEFYGMENNNNSVEEKGEMGNEISKKYNFWTNIHFKYITCLEWLWVFTDNVPIQYGNSKIWKHGEVYYGLSNGMVSSHLY